MIRTIRRGTQSAAVLAIAGAVLLTGCAPTEDAPPQPTQTQAETEAPPTALEKWDAAYAFLEQQSKDVEVFCSRVDVSADGAGNRALGDTVDFFGFEERKAWTGDTLTRTEWTPGESVDLCTVNVPATVKYDMDSINAYLGERGMKFPGDNIVMAPNVDLVEIAYPGSTPDDPDAQFADSPGLWGLALSLTTVEGARAEDGGIVPPADEKTADTYLAAIAPLLDWYGYTP